MDRRRQIHAASSLGRDQRSEEVLPLDADVEQVHLEADGDGGGRKDQRCGSIEHLDELVGVAGGLDDRGEGIDGVLPRDGEDESGDPEGNQHAEERRSDRHYGRLELGRLARREDLVEWVLGDVGLVTF